MNVNDEDPDRLEPENQVALAADILDKLCPALGVNKRMVQRVALDLSYDSFAIAHVQMLGSWKILDIQWKDVQAEIRYVDGRTDQPTETSADTLLRTDHETRNVEGGKG